MAKFRFSYALIAVFVALSAVAPGLAQGSPDSMMHTLNVGGNDALGPFLVGPDGMTLYTFTRDPLDGTACVDACANNWPPLTVEDADSVTVAEGIPGEAGTITRPDGTLQVTYNGMPLYYWNADEAPGDARGNARFNVWWVMPPATVYVGRNADLGSFLVGPNGFTLYMFANDQPGVSNCVDACAENWPPLTVASEDELIAGANVLGALGTLTRADGSLQVTYNGMPLYFWVNDAARGDATGQGFRDLWSVVAPETVATRTSDTLGEYLVGPSGFTVYIFANDQPGVSNCVDACADNWPPLTVSASDALVAGEGITGELGTLTRADGRLQVTYNGMPLYYWINDAMRGDTTGEGFRDVWTVARP
jgi:predicted lipoprotein with Yx(FWY)xxD motif